MFPMLPDPTAPVMAPTPRAAPVDRTDADSALAALLSGNERFVAGRPAHGHAIGAAIAAAQTPRPVAAVVGCMDARVPVEAVLDQDFGALFVARAAGHVLDRAGFASLELAVTAFDVRLVLVLGHTGCAAVAAAVEANRGGRRPPGHVGFVFDEIGRSLGGVPPGGYEDPERVARRHVGRTVTAVRDTLGAARVSVVGAVYDVRTGRVEVLEVRRSPVPGSAPSRNDR